MLRLTWLLLRTLSIQILLRKQLKINLNTTFFGF
nr:MAG TPA: hypothetical protein [Caudoviricetes sp.]